MCGILGASKHNIILETLEDVDVVFFSEATSAFRSGLRMNVEVAKRAGLTEYDRAILTNKMSQNIWTRNRFSRSVFQSFPSLRCGRLRLITQSEFDSDGQTASALVLSFQIHGCHRAHFCRVLGSIGFENLFHNCNLGGFRSKL